MYKSDNTHLIMQEDYGNDVENNNRMVSRTNLSLEGLSIE